MAEENEIHEERKIGKDHDPMQKYLVWGTWALVIVSLISMFLVRRDNGKQLAELQKSTEMQWRPYLSIEERAPASIGFGYRLGESAESDTTVRALDSLAVSDVAYFAVKYIGYDFFRTLVLRNFGTTPLRVTKMLASTLSQYEWSQVYKKSTEDLASHIYMTRDFSPLQTDIIIMPRDSFTTDKPKGLPRRLPKSEFESQLKKDSQIVIYPYAFVEYEDFFNHRYNVMLVDFVIVKFRLQSGYLREDTTLSHAGIERIRWDLPLH